ncbi:MAG: hypothetical protein RLY82_798 [Pseudomonadota bacterium]|jgi:TetR/AcrR family transcriptional regulator
MSDAQTTPTKSRPAPGERRIQILQTLAEMLQTPGGERVTTALLAKRLDVSEAALYRHFASKAQMFEGLIDFIESTVFGLINQIIEREANPAQQCKQIAAMVLTFGEKNPGMTRVMVGDALVFEHERLQTRMNQFFDKIESSFKQAMRGMYATSSTPSVDANAHAAALAALLAGRLQRYARSGFKKMPTEQMDATLAFMI